MKISIKKKGKQTEQLLSSLNQLSNKTLKVGHFAEDGLHSDSKLTYPDLLNIWHLGAAKGNEGIIKSPLFQFVASKLDKGLLSTNPVIRNALNTWAKNVLNNTADEALYNKLGEVLVEEYSKVFGNPKTPHMPSVGSNTTPMLDTGELKENTKYKIVRK